MFSTHTCREARVNRDIRYDGLFYSGSTTTRVYCRPICPGRPPRASNARYFPSHGAAHAAGYRPCLRCRPESAPGYLARGAAAWQVRRTLDRIHRGNSIGRWADGGQSDCSAPFLSATGASEQAYAAAVRLTMAKMLLSDTALAVPRIAAACGFSSSRRLTEALSRLYGREVSALRKPLPTALPHRRPAVALMLAYRPPLDWPALMDYFGKRAIAGVESVNGDTYQRSFRMNGETGWLSVQHVPLRHALRLEIHSAGSRSLMQIVWRVRRMFDLDADPLQLSAAFGNDRVLGPAWSRHPGLRVPVGWDAFEFAVRAIVGQLISVRAATTLMGRIAAGLSGPAPDSAPPAIYRVFPDAATVLESDLAPYGLSRGKAAAIRALAEAVVNGPLDLSTAADLGPFVNECKALKGVGDWTAQTIAMRGMGHPDAFPAGDLGIVKALTDGDRRLSAAAIAALSRRWRPWRAYAAMLLWTGATAD